VIPNTATSTYRETPGGPIQREDSNRTQVTARVGEASLQIVKTADRASAEPGDTVVYQLQVKNTGTTEITNVRVTDRLPLGFKLIERSVRASINRQRVELSEVKVEQDGRKITFGRPTLQAEQTLTITYAAVITPDALRGSGRNVAVANGRTPGGGTVSSGSASYRVQIRPGILADCGTIIGRVFVDKNFDGEQQPGEPGVPNAVIFMDDGNRITTDENGLFSLAFVVAGARTGTLDLTSLPGYTIAPNLYRIEGNSTSRLVKLSPGGMGRMNFAVTPTFKEGQR
jgi:uncharacterized repeat protein (TIGR01451 family)